MFYIAIDFDGTLADHQFPEIGQEVDGAFAWLRHIQIAYANVRLLLWTMRDDDRPVDTGPVLQQAVDFCGDRGLKFYGINRNPDQDWSKSPKAYANVYVDDNALGCPLTPGPTPTSRPVADWSVIGPKLVQMIMDHSTAKQIAKHVLLDETANLTPEQLDAAVSQFNNQSNGVQL